MEVPDYQLPEAAIAQRPVEPRHAARLLVATDPDGGFEHRQVRDLPGLVGAGDVLVVNTSRVIPARLRLRKATGGSAEVLLLEPEPERGPGVWQALVRPGRRLPPGTRLSAQPATADAVEVGERLDHGRRLVRLLADPAEVLAACGSVALPPYIHEPLADPDRYQTVYADAPGSVAAPTAGLHLTTAVLDRCRQRGAEVHGLDLAVGLATFRPLDGPTVEDHVMHTERYQVPAATLAACQRANRVVAVGTTTVRALETAARTGAAEGQSDLFIRPGFEFAMVDVLMTNFHLPRSSLLVLLEAFCGPRWRTLYAAALADGYRFLSFGDAMLVGKRPPAA
ncbi:MAG TPA: tRNA preQ1(34) S-adenosylmethionine ribosyltransferase-isomerase QueA [Acidimicrobiales bacterium]